MMEPFLPFYKFLSFGDQAGMLIGLVTGISFGFFLERAGFGSGRRLSDVWYGRDFAVIRVMFVAVITASVGIYAAYAMGILDLDRMYLNPTFYWPQIVGGTIFGAGFVIGGYCPGTSLVATATGKIDGMVFLLGFLFGVIGFAEAFPMFKEFYFSSSAGRLFLFEVLGLTPGTTVLLIVLVALATFFALALIEAKLHGVSRTAHLPRMGKVVPGVAILVAAFMLIPYAGNRQSSAHVVEMSTLEGPHLVDALTVASWYAEGRRDFEIVDLRSAKEFAAGSLPDALNCIGCHSDRGEGRTAVDSGSINMPNLQANRIVFVAEGAVAKVPEFFTGTKSRLFVLKGGYNAFHSMVMSEPKPCDVADPKWKAAQKQKSLSSDMAEISQPAHIIRKTKKPCDVELNETQLAELKKRTELYSFFTGAKAEVRTVPVKKRVILRRHRPSSGANEGC